MKSCLVHPTVAYLREELIAGRTTSRALVEQALARIADPLGEGPRAYMKVYADLARAEADASDALRAAGVVRSPVEGLPVSVKDLFDVGGDVTLAGSKALASEPPATRDAPAVARLRAAGAVILGRTSMVEFAFGGIGTNPHFGTPANPHDRGTGRIPGGSSSGAAVAVADGLCVMGLGSDTRGSVRIPAALCGVTGFKPTQSRVPREGAFPLSYTLDSVGPLARSVSCCAVFDAILAADGQPADARAPEPAALPSLRLLAPRCFALDDLDPPVAAAFERALAALSAAGARISTADAPCLDAAHALFAGGGFAGAEAAQIHRALLKTKRELYDPNVAKRIEAGEGFFSGADYVQLGLDRRAVIGEAAELLSQYDAVLLPTTPSVAPTIEEVSVSGDEYARWNLRMLRNPGLINMIDGCAVSLPCHSPGEEAPIGLMVAGVGGSDRRVLAVARAIEESLAARAE
mmetsp:Transcript_44262/g.145015  ORF Transcript_44262/g.145015 Transcript_44262/m.145015 type:complete len:463 (-) Transcript_44262:69-1457(-)